MAWQKQAGPEFVTLTNDATYTITTSTNGSTLAIANTTLAMDGDTYQLQVLDTTNVVYMSPTFTASVIPPTVLHVGERGGSRQWLELEQRFRVAGPGPRRCR